MRRASIGLPTVASMALGLASLAIVLAPAPLASPEDLARVVVEERFRRALALSLASSSVSAAIALGVALLPAYYIARSGGVVFTIVSNLHLLLLSIPPVGLGTAALLLFTRYPGVSTVAEALGLLFTPAGVVVAQVLVTTPIAASMLVGVFSMVPRELEETARVYGATTVDVLARIVLPISIPGVLSAWAITFFRALGEFGATLIIAGNIPGRTETLPIALYNALSVADVGAASAIYIVILVVGLVSIGIHALLRTRLRGGLGAL